MNPSGIRGKLGQEDGVAAVEFGLIAGLLFLILIGIFAFGEAYSRVQVYEGAAREGARLASVRADYDDIRSRVLDAADPYDEAVEDEDIDVLVNGVDGVCDDSTVGDKVEVTWEQSVEMIPVPFLPNLDFDRRITGTFRCE